MSLLRGCFCTSKSHGDKFLATSPSGCLRLCLCRRLFLTVSIIFVVKGLRPSQDLHLRQGDGSVHDSRSPSEKAMKIYIYDVPAALHEDVAEKEPRCTTHMFASEIEIHKFLLASIVRTLDPQEADWFYTPMYTNCDLSEQGLPLITGVPQLVRSAVTHISVSWPYWNRSGGADHFFVVPHDFGACFHFQEKAAIWRGIYPLLRRATLIQTFGQSNHPCMGNNYIIIPPYVPPTMVAVHRLSPATPRSIFAYFRGTIYDVRNDPKGGYYARGIRAALWEAFREHPMFDIATDHPTTYYEDMQRSLFCLCPRGWAPWSPRIVEAVILGCIPVIIADDIVLPFEDVIPWDKMAVFVNESNVGDLDAILASMSAFEVKQKQVILADPAIKNALLFSKDRIQGDAFHLILSSLSRQLRHVRLHVPNPR
ncbi:hypothetical protein KP509_10G006200 [Ceratopteris richardii]|uniref:Exostosin GT47 domain-containing protein n=1 Tax=Ceratopteris richardii TaxID=49495 RepID=A0A8T2TWA4_CERRI|nr:hypothetical protein KP509_10G006200 [Ceratopteris richardii]